MNHHHLRRAAGSLLLLATVAAVLGPPAQASEPRSAAERVFLVDMVGHHAMAVEMAEMAQKRASHAELKNLAADIIASQTAEQKRMRAWLKRWYDVTPGAGMHHEDMADMEEIEKSATAAEFEVRFMAMMTMHHTQAIERATQVRNRRIHAKTRGLTANIIETQDREVAQMRDWLAEWYGN
jgi:uncharacterized protein (DUF305 family)